MRLSGLILLLKIKETSQITFYKNGQRELGNFFQALERRIQLISYYPELYAIVEGTDITRKSVLNKRTIIFYEFREGLVEVLYLFNTYQNPDRLEL